MNGAGVSVVRSGREVDYGWFFLDRKRRENYDDWWRCEICFDPVLDEAFGITHTKQQIRPLDYLIEAIGSDVQTRAKALNGRVRQAHLRLKAAVQTAEVEQLASERDELLNPLPANRAPQQSATMIQELLHRHPVLRETISNTEQGKLQYRIIEDDMKDAGFYSFAHQDGLFLLVLNPSHPFHRKVYRPLAEKEDSASRATRAQIDLLLLAAARAEAEATRSRRRQLDGRLLA